MKVCGKWLFSFDFEFDDTFYNEEFISASIYILQPTPQKTQKYYIRNYSYTTNKKNKRKQEEENSHKLGVVKRKKRREKKTRKSAFIASRPQIKLLALAIV